MIGVLVAKPLNLLVRFIGKLTRFDHSLTGEMNTIVVCKFKGMGSIIQSTPLIQALRKRYPAAKIIYVSSVENKGILEQIALVDEILLMNDRSIFVTLKSSFLLIGKLIRIRPDLYIDLEIYSNFSSIIATASMSRDRFGYYLKTSQYRMGMYTHMMYFNTKAPIAEAYLQFARLLGISDTSPELYSIPEIESLKKKESNYIVINPNASDLRYERRWPAEKFIELIKRIRSENNNVPILLIGSQTEKDYVLRISDVLKDFSNIIDLSGKTSLVELIELLRTADLLITNDTGPMHLAASLCTPVLALFGPCNPEQYGLGQNIHVIYKNFYCSPCVHEFLIPPCKGDNQCMKQITVDEVFKAFTNLHANVPAELIHYFYQENKVLGKVIR